MSSPNSENPDAGDDPTNKVQNLICVEYPGKVENVEKMTATLGGMKRISEVCSGSNRRLELRFRPEDQFCKPACGERINSSSFLLKVTRLKKKKKDPNEPDEYKLVPEIVGTVGTTFKFTNLCDFQYLPMVRNPNEDPTDVPGYRPIHHEVLFDKLETSSWLEQPAPLFLPPAAFSRMDAPQDYQYRREAANDKATVNTPYNIIGRTRQRRSHHAIFVTFDVESVPQKPRAIAVDQLKVKFIDQEMQLRVQKKFEECPMWSKNALHAITKVPNERLKFILPSLAYYFTTGPWRNQWVQFGYDPRKNKESAMYQTLDYRIRLQGGAKHKVKAKRSYANYLLPYKATNWSKSRTSVISADALNAKDNELPSKQTESERAEEEEKFKDIYLFRPGRIPPCRQMFYQYKDLQLDQAQALLTDLKSKMVDNCDEKWGWFPVGTDIQLREILTKSINEQLAVERGPPVEGELDEFNLMEEFDSEASSEEEANEGEK